MANGNFPTKAVLGGVAVVGGLVITAYAVQQITNPGAKGGSCTQPGTPCYAALSPYQQQFQTCANQYASYLNQFLQENATAGTGFTSAQLSTLTTLQQCMDAAAADIAKTAQGFEPNSVADILAEYIGIAVIAAATLYGAGQFIKGLRTNPRTGASAASSLNDAMVQAAAQARMIASDAIASVRATLSNLTATNISLDQSALDALATENVIALEEATAIAADDAATLAVDAASTDEMLAAL